MCARRLREALEHSVFIDNNPALVSLLRGHTEDPAANAAVKYFWEIQARAPCDVWLERVRSSRNHADAPSRLKRPAGSALLGAPFPNIPLSQAAALRPP